MKRFLAAIALFVSLALLGGCALFPHGQEQAATPTDRVEKLVIKNDAWIEGHEKRLAAIEKEVAELKKLATEQVELARVYGERFEEFEQNDIGLQASCENLRNVIDAHDRELGRIGDRLREAERRCANSPCAGEPVPPTAAMSDKDRLVGEERLLADLAARVVARRLCSVKLMRCEDEIASLCEAYKESTAPEARKGLMEKIGDLEIARKKIFEEAVAIDAEMEKLRKQLEELKAPPAKSEKG